MITIKLHSLSPNQPTRNIVQYVYYIVLMRLYDETKVRCKEGTTDVRG